MTLIVSKRVEPILAEKATCRQTLADCLIRKNALYCSFRTSEATRPFNILRSLAQGWWCKADTYSSFLLMICSLTVVFSLNTNIPSVNVQRYLRASQILVSQSMERLSSGLRINHAKDDPAGIAISQRFTSQINGLDQTRRNANDGTSMLQIAEGALDTVINSFHRIRVLAVQAANGIYSNADRAFLQAEVQQLKQHIQFVADNTDFNGIKLLNGSLSSLNFQIGANAGGQLRVGPLPDIRLDSLASTSTPARIQGVVPTGTGGGGGTLGSTTADLGPLFSILNFAVFGVSFDVDGHTVALSQNYIGDLDASHIASDISDALGANYNVSYSGFSVTIENATGAAAPVVDNYQQGLSVVPDITAQFVGADGTPAVPPEFLAGSFLVNDTAVAIDAAADANERLSDLVQAINDADAGVTASTSGGKLSLVSRNNSDITIVNDSFDDATAFLQQTGLSDGDSASRVIQGGLGGIDISSVAGAVDAMQKMDVALGQVLSGRAALGAVQNRLISAVNQNANSAINLSAARSRIQDLDYAAEISALTRAQILKQAGMAMLAQAKALPQNVLKLLQF